MNGTSFFQSVEIDGQQASGESVFPFVIECQTDWLPAKDVLALIGRQRDELLRLATLHGGVAFRGFPTPTVEDFDAFVQAFGMANFPYDESLSNAVRVNRTERVFSANEAPPDVRIFFHHEMAQTPLYPKFIFFYCEVAAEQGGATPLCRSDVLYERLKFRRPEFAAKCEQEGLRYTNVMPDSDDPESGMGRSWRKTLRAEDREQAERRLSELGYTFEWMPDGSLKASTPRLPAVLRLSDGRRTFFNQLIAAFCGWKDSRNDPSEAIRHGDGSKLDDEAVRVAVELSEELAYDHAWQAGDIVLLDNTVVMHARRPFRGTRKVLASLAEKRSNAF